MGTALRQIRTLRPLASLPRDEEETASCVFILFIFLSIPFENVLVRTNTHTHTHIGHGGVVGMGTWDLCTEHEEEEEEEEERVDEKITYEEYGR